MPLTQVRNTAGGRRCDAQEYCWLTHDCRAGLASLLRDDFDLVGTVGDGQALIDAAQRLRPDVIVADIAMPVMDGLELHRLTAAASTPIIFLTMHADAQLATAALRAGASGYVLKHSAGEELITAMQEVLQGGPI